MSGVANSQWNCVLKSEKRSAGANVSMVLPACASLLAPPRIPLATLVGLERLYPRTLHNGECLYLYRYVKVAVRIRVKKQSAKPRRIRNEHPAHYLRGC